MKIFYLIFTLISLYITAISTLNTFYVPHQTTLLLVLNIVSFGLCVLTLLGSQAVILLIYLGSKDQQNRLIKNLFKTLKVK